ncbi:Hsp70 family protein [Dactylosporangium sp. NPDC049525]|uniref:Hsp70 family protein n=1 Tax=Dactylosporangium sp. NPDC049525 TaxID=3154730 RepID=UPI00342BD264
MTLSGAWLGIDFGTSSTVAFLRRGDGTVTPLLFDASPLLPSGVFADDDGPVLTGADAVRAAAGSPAGYEPNPKQRIDDATTWLGGRERAVHGLIAAVLRRVADEACRVAGTDPAGVVLTYPAGWSRARLAVLAAAADAAGLAGVGFVREPVAAATYFDGVLGHDLGQRQCLVVYDFGAGTFDVSVVRRGADGVEVLAADGLTDIGGNDLDAVVVDHLRSLSADPVAWGRLDWPQSAADHRARRSLWADARSAKEQLTRHTRAEVHVPVVDVTLHITREEFDAAARPHLERTVALTIATLRAAGVSREAIGGVLLVGGSSRIPLVATLLHRTLRLAPTVMEQPELVVAHGSLFLVDQQDRLEPPPPPAPVVATPSTPVVAAPPAVPSATPPAVPSAVTSRPLPTPASEALATAQTVPPPATPAEPAPVVPMTEPTRDPATAAAPPPAVTPPAEPQAQATTPSPSAAQTAPEPVTGPRRRRRVVVAAAAGVAALAVVAALLIGRPWDNGTGRDPSGDGSPTGGSQPAATQASLDSVRRSAPGCEESDERVVWTAVRASVTCSAAATTVSKQVGWDIAYTQSYAELRMSLRDRQLPGAFTVAFTIGGLSAPGRNGNRNGCGGLAVHSAPDGHTYDYFNVCGDGWVEFVRIVNDAGTGNQTRQLTPGPDQGSGPAYSVLVTVTTSAVTVTVSNNVGGSETITAATASTTSAYVSLMTTWRNVGATASFSNFTYSATG